MSRPAIALAPVRVDGYVPLRDYAVIGDGRTVALVARDGSVDWLAWPNLDSPSVFAAVLDPDRGGRFRLEPLDPYTAEHHYLPDTNVLRTRFTTATGTVTVTDALTLSGHPSLAPDRELVRRVDGLAGTVPLTWRVTPRFGYGTRTPRTPRIRRQGDAVVAGHGGEAVAVSAWQAGGLHREPGSVHGRFRIDAGSRAVIAVTYTGQEPLVLPSRTDCEARLDHTVAVWRAWTARRSFPAPWSDAVRRSALALKLLVFAPSAALAAAGTCSLPEAVGGVRNWDYRYCWIRDAAFTVATFLRLGCAEEADGYFWWLMQASQLTHPRLRVLYRLDGGPRTPERTLPLRGYRDSAPVRVGNAAAWQVQLDTYGELLQTAWLYAAGGRRLDRDIGRRLAGIADFVCRHWRQPDSGIWEVRSAPEHFTQSKMMCWVALDRALDLAGRGLIPSRHVERWRRDRDAVARFVENRCFNPGLNSYSRSAGSPDLDAAVLLGLLHGYRPTDPGRFDGTVDAIGRRLRHGPYVDRYTGPDGLPGDEGAFLACSFWLAEALARLGRVDEAATLMEQLVALGNDVGLYSEEIDPDTGAFLGNLPQGLSHLALISAACAIGDAAR
jgi:GH15 family glucan-1,4-alpha-glucosidase